MVVIDRTTKYAQFFVFSHPFKVSTIVVAFMETIQNLHGNLNIIVSDRDTIFICNFCIELFSCLGTWLDHILSYHPQSDGETKIVNKCLEEYLHWFAFDQ